MQARCCAFQINLGVGPISRNLVPIFFSTPGTQISIGFLSACLTLFQLVEGVSLHVRLGHGLDPPEVLVAGLRVEDVYPERG